MAEISVNMRCGGIKVRSRLFDICPDLIARFANKLAGIFVAAGAEIKREEEKESGQEIKYYRCRGFSASAGIESRSRKVSFRRWR